jgi:hypothetical protein
MSWQQKSKWHLELVTPKGTYCVSKALVYERAVYSAWPPKPPSPPTGKPFKWQDHTAVMIGCYDTAEEAKRACERHAGLIP